MVATLAGALGVGGVVVSLLHLDRLPFSVCFFKTMTGMPCMTCGTTRALGLLARLHPWNALHMNPLATVILCGLLLYGAADVLLLARGQRLAFDPGARLGRALWILFALLVVVNWGYLIAHRV
jgi:hypothetical protein